eukprot:c17994_g1_i1 orf=129-1337(+)
MKVFCEYWSMLGRSWPVAAAPVPCGWFPSPFPRTLKGKSARFTICSSAIDKQTEKPSKAMVLHTPEAAEEPAADLCTEDFSKDWLDFGRSPQDIPPLVKKLMLEVKSLESELGEALVFGGPRGALQGRAKAAEEHRHRAFYGYLPDSEEKLQFFSARQVACRILGCRGYLCKDCWLPMMDCMCKKVETMSLWPGVRLWLYMHPKDYLRKNNSGKLLWQVYGGDSTRLCVFGIQEQEDAMWDAFKHAGQGSVWYLYPEQGIPNSHVNEILVPEELTCQKISMEKCRFSLNFILIDGTWSNSKAMISRLQSRAKATWQEQSMQSVSLSLDKLSVLHDLRPQPSLDRTCTAAAAAQLLRELDCREELGACKLGEAADALDKALKHLLEALTTRRIRVGRSVTRLL